MMPILVKSDDTTPQESLGYTLLTIVERIAKQSKKENDPKVLNKGGNDLKYM